MISRSVGRTALAALALVAVVACGCTDRTPAVEPPAPAPAETPSSPGAIDIALAVPPSFQIATVNYQLTNTGYTKSGSLDVSQTQVVSTVLGGIPAGPGYTLALTATDTAKKFTSCSGSSPVNVVSGATTPVSVAIDCHLPQPALTPPAVPIPMPAVVLLAVALLAAGVRSNDRRGARRPSRRD